MSRGESTQEPVAGPRRLHKLGLGCVELGQDYGRVHPTGRPDDAEARALLARAAALGVRCLDTAPTYGDSEQRIGDFCPRGASFDIVSKLSFVEPGGAELSLKRSLEAVRQPVLYGLLAHSADELLDGARGERRFAQLERLREEGRVKRIGASVYSPVEARELLRRFPGLDLMQLPMSVLDRRFETSGVLGELAARGVEVHARSVLLQGALALASDSLPRALAGMQPALERFQSCARQVGCTPVQAALSWICSQPSVDVVLVGASRAHELETAVEAARMRIDVAAFADCAVEHSDALDPRRWRADAS